MRIHHFMLLFLCSAAGCIGDEPRSVYEADGAVDEDLTGDMVEVDLPAAPEQPDALHRITATDVNLHILRAGCYHAFKLDWACASQLDGRDASFTHKASPGDNDTEVADNFGNYWGQCVSLVKAATKSNVVTADWQPGANVFAGLASGTAIATFPGGHYDGHAAIFLSYVSEGGSIIGIRVADQNWYTLGGQGIVARHLIRKGGSGVANANNYHAILVP